MLQISLNSIKSNLRTIGVDVEGSIEQYEAEKAAERAVEETDGEDAQQQQEEDEEGSAE